MKEELPKISLERLGVDPWVQTNRIVWRHPFSSELDMFLGQACKYKGKVYWIEKVDGESVYIKRGLKTNVFPVPFAAIKISCKSIKRKGTKRLVSELLKAQPGCIIEPPSAFAMWSSTADAKFTDSNGDEFLVPWNY